MHGYIMPMLTCRLKSMGKRVIRVWAILLICLHNFICMRWFIYICVDMYMCINLIASRMSICAYIAFVCTLLLCTAL